MKEILVRLQRERALLGKTVGYVSQPLKNQSEGIARQMLWRTCEQLDRILEDLQHQIDRTEASKAVPA